MREIYKDILNKINLDKKLLAVLIDPDKAQVKNMASFISKVNRAKIDYIFIGGSTVEQDVTEKIVLEIKKYTQKPIVIFPGDVTQITNKADALLFISLISGNNPDYLIGKHINAASKLLKSSLEVIPTGYILIENGNETSVQKVTKTTPLSRNNIELILNIAKAGEYLGMKCIYLEAGSGATNPVTTQIISRVKEILKIPLIVGGGIRSIKQLKQAYNAGADLVVIGTAFEQDESFFDELTK